jgi:hypothetical protein
MGSVAACFGKRGSLAGARTPPVMGLTIRQCAAVWDFGSRFGQVARAYQRFDEVDSFVEPDTPMTPEN